MKADCKDALGIALEEMESGPNGDGLWHFYNASPIPAIEPVWIDRLICEQPFRPEFLKLERSGYRVLPEIEMSDESHSGAIVLLDRNRLLNEYRISQAWNRLPTGGRLIVAGNKTDGIGSVRKWFGNHLSADGSYSKYHAIVFWAVKTDSRELPGPDIDRTVNGYRLAEGMFSANGPDKGSVLLARHFSERIAGEVADLGSGWGYLSAELLKKSDRIRRIDLFEADYRSVEASRKNLSFGGAEININWIDVTSEFDKRPYDWVIMNPPFHTGRAAEPRLGQRFIEVAASTLPRGGRLLMVANRNLPYEKTMVTLFRKLEKLEEREGYKVIEAIR